MLDIFAIIGKIVCWGFIGTVVILLSVSVLTGLVDFASTGVGAFVLLLIGYKLYKDYSEKQ